MQKEGAVMADADRQKAEKTARDEQREFSRKAGELGVRTVTEAEWREIAGLER